MLSQSNKTSQDMPSFRVRIFLVDADFHNAPLLNGDTG
jgi:hypothetical protein